MATNESRAGEFSGDEQKLQRPRRASQCALLRAQLHDRRARFTCGSGKARVDGAAARSVEAAPADQMAQRLFAFHAAMACGTGRRRRRLKFLAELSDDVSN
jgi:hypothetical protein